MSRKTLDDLFGLDGRVAVVTGGGGVLGGAMSRGLAAQGAKVAVLNRSPESVDAMAKTIRDEGGTAVGVPCDVTDAVSLVEAEKRVADELGPADILVNAAGGNHKSATTGGVHVAEQLDPSFFDLDPEAIRFVFNLNLLGTLLASQAFGKGMVERGRGCIVNVSSMSAFTPLTKVGTYSAAKAAVNSFTQWLAVHLAPANVRVNAVAPGFFLTEQNRFLLTDEQTGEPTPRGQTIIDHTPMRRYGDPEELVGALLWLCGDGAAFVTGTVIPVDGGFDAFSGV
jgi:NAD(P)-dependent dehydrogenase (short-subunit alcohol dehydrogenase family)